MANANYHTIIFQPVGMYSEYLPTIKNTFQYTRPKENISNKINEYFLRALVYIRSIIRLLRSSSPFFEQYGPVLKELPKMYKLLKVMNELKSENTETLTTDVEDNQLAKPKLYI